MRRTKVALAVVAVLMGGVSGCGDDIEQPADCHTRTDNMHKSSTVPGTMNIHTWSYCETAFITFQMELQIERLVGSTWYPYGNFKPVTFKNGAAYRDYKSNVAAPCNTGTYRMAINWVRVTAKTSTINQGYSVNGETYTNPCQQP